MGIEKIFKPEILLSGGYEGGPSVISDKRTKRIYKLSSNENLIGSAPSAIEVVRNATDLNIYPSGSPKPLYTALSRHYEQQLEEAQFIAGNGGSDLIQLITRAFLGPDTNYIISNPCFAPYEMFSSWTGAKAIDIPLLDPDYRLDVAGILGAINEQTRLIFLTSPNNPSGTYIRKSELDRILEGIPDHVVVIYDEVYHHFTCVPDYTTALTYVQRGHPIIAINSFSKAYGLANLRVGYGYSTTQISSYIRKIIRPFILNGISLQAAIEALEDTTFLNQTVQATKRERTKLMEGLQKLGIQYWSSEANFVLIRTRLPEAIMIKKMQHHGVMVRGTTGFGAPGCVRITVGSPEATQVTLGALATILG